MKVLMVSDVYFPRINGVSTSIETFRRELVGQGVQVDLVVPDYDGAAAEEGVYRVPSWPVPFDPEDRFMRPAALRRQLDVLATQGYDLIHIQTPFAAHYAGLAAARRWSVPAVTTYHTLFEEYLFHYIPLLPRVSLRGVARAFSRRQCNALDAVVVPSQAMRERLADYGVTAALHVLPTGIPLARFSRGEGAAFRQQHGITPARPVALYVGRVAHEKNIGFLIDVMAQLRARRSDALLLITGEGPARAVLERQVYDRGLSGQVRFLGYLDRHGELADAYAAADVFVFASRTETQGLVLLEAMAMGLPVVALAEMGTIDILAPESGAVVPANDVAAFSAALDGVLADPRRRRAMGDQGRAWAMRWSDSVLAERLANLYSELCRIPGEDTWRG